MYGVGCMVVSHSCDNKDISAPRWGLAGWLGLSLAKYHQCRYLNSKACLSLVNLSSSKTWCSFFTDTFIGCGILYQGRILFRQYQNISTKHLLGFFPDMRKVPDNCFGNTSLAAPGALTHCLQRHTACNT